MSHSFAPFNAEETLFLTSHTGIDFIGTDFSQPHWLCVSSSDGEGRLQGLCVFEFKSATDAHFTVAVKDKRFATKRGMRAMFEAVFSRAARVTALVEPWNHTAIRQAKIMGFQPEGFLRRAVEGDRDALIFGILREECRYLERGHHGQRTQTAQPVPDRQRPAAG